MAVTREMSRTGWREIWGIALFCVGILALLSILSYHPGDIRIHRNPPNSPPYNLIGPFGAWTGYIFLHLFGVLAYLLPFALIGATAIFLFQREGRLGPRLLALGGFFACLCWLVALMPSAWPDTLKRLNIALSGGLIGHGLGVGLVAPWMGRVGSGILGVGALLLSGVFLFRISPRVAGRFTVSAWEWFRVRIARLTSLRMERKELIEEQQRQLAKQRQRLERELKREMRSKPEEPIRPEPAPQPTFVRPREPTVRPTPVPEPLPSTPAPAQKPAPEDTSEFEPAQVRRRLAKEKPAEPALAPDPAPVKTSDGSEYRLPPISLLDPLPAEHERQIQTDHLDDGARILVETLAEFGIDVLVTNVEIGPVVTRYELLPAPGVRVERITGLSGNIALSMKAESVRVLAPIPGKGVVGIEVPNPKTTMVFLRDVLESEAWSAKHPAIPLALGQDVGGRVIVADLADMPHLLIAGATGAGKTVCMNSLLCGMLMRRTPDELRLMLVDPKIVEFSAFANLPHLVVPVVTDSKKVALGLRWAINEMEKRYKLFARVGVRNIKSYNARPIAKQPSLFGEEVEEDAASDIPDRLPYIAIVVDELADLMLVARAEIETSIARLAQLSRAVGIHMILATQRPSVNVITGTIKANFPARIAFQVAQKVDSRTILDAIGADKLLGRGDMLFLPPGSGRMIRAQGCLTKDNEVRAIVDFIRQQSEPRYELAIKAQIEQKSADLPDTEEDDELIESAMEVIRQTRRASTSSLQRRLRIGYTRAARIMDLLEERGVVGPAQGSDPREILIDLDGMIPANAVISEPPKRVDHDE